MLKTLSLFLIPALMVVLVGCDSRPKVYPVTGTVTIKGTPAPEMTRVNFEPVSGGELAAGMVDATGGFTLYSGNEGRPGAVPGSYKVFLSPDASSDAYMTGKPSGVPGVPSAGPIPDDFLSAATSPLTVEVTEDENVIDVTIE